MSSSDISIHGEIEIAADRQKVFSYFSNLENDRFWRKEINGTKMDGPPKIGAHAEESSFLSKRVPANILQLVCSELEEGRRIVYSTPDSSAFSLRSERSVSPVSDQFTKVIYKITFSKNIVRHGLGFNLPSFLIRMAANSDMKKYLVQLKKNLEN